MPIGAIVGAVLAVGQIAYGAYKKNQAKKRDANNPFTPYNIDQTFYDNLGLAQSELSQGGFSDATRNFYQQTLEQNLAASNNATLQGGGSANDIAANYANFGNQMKSLAVEDEKLKMLKTQSLFERGIELAGQKATQWRINNYDRWKDEKVATALMTQQGDQAINSGINTGVNSLANYLKELNVDKIPSNKVSEPILDVTDLTQQQQPYSNYNWQGYQNVGNPTPPKI